MIAEDDDRPVRRAGFALGEDLTELSIEELESRIDVLETEISRFRQSIEDKKQSKQAADSFFRS